MTEKKTIQLTPKYGLCLDWETSGSSWGGDSTVEYQGIAFGAIVFDTATLDPIKTLKLYIKFDSARFKWSLDAQRIHGLTQEFLDEHGVSQEEAAKQLAELILEYFGDTKVMFLGHNAGFDIRFTNQLLMSIDIEFSVERKTDSSGWIQLHHVVLDTSSAGFISLGIFKSDLLFEAIGLEERGEHDPLTDALYTLQTASALRQLVQVALEG